MLCGFCESQQIAKTVAHIWTKCDLDSLDTSSQNNRNTVIEQG